MNHYLTQFRGFRIPGRKTPPVNFTQRADKGVAVLAADFAVLVAVTSVETWFAHAALPSSRPQLGRLFLRGRDSNRQRAATSNPCQLPGPWIRFPRWKDAPAAFPGASRLMPSAARAIRRSG